MKERILKMLKGQTAFSVFFILFGLCMLLAPIESLNVICKVVFGLALVIAGIYNLVVYIRDMENMNLLNVFSGVIVLVIGMFLFYNPGVVIALLPKLLGGFVLVDCIWLAGGSVKLKKRSQDMWKFFLINSVVFAVLGLVLAVNPFKAIKTTIMFAGAVFFCNGVLDIVCRILLLKKLKEQPVPAEDAFSGDETVDGSWESVSAEQEEAPVISETVREQESEEQEDPGKEEELQEKPAAEKMQLTEDLEEAIPESTTEADKAPETEAPKAKETAQETNIPEVEMPKVGIPKAEVPKAEEEILEEWVD